MDIKESYLYVMLVGAALAVIVLSVAGIATITGVFPGRESATESVATADAWPECARCGVIESVWNMRGDVNEAELPSDESRVRYAVRVFMENGTYRTLYYSELPLFNTGEKVKVSDGALILRN